MKGFTYTLEAALGTIFVISLILTTFNLQETNTENPAFESVERQLNQLQETGILTEAVTQKNPEIIQSKLDTTPYRASSRIEIEQLDKSYNSSSQFYIEFNYTDIREDARLFIWTEGQEITVNTETEQLYRGTSDFKSLDISSKIEEGSNELQVTNLAEERVGYLLSLTETYGSEPGNSNEIRVYSRLTFPEESQNLSTVNTYVWR